MTAVFCLFYRSHPTFRNSQLLLPKFGKSEQFPFPTRLFCFIPLALYIFCNVSMIESMEASIIVDEPSPLTIHGDLIAVSDLILLVA